MIPPVPPSRSRTLLPLALPAAGLERAADAPQGPELAAWPRTLREGGGWYEHREGRRSHAVRPLPVDP